MDSCSDSFFLRRSITLETLLALCKQQGNKTFGLWDIFTFMVSSSSSGTCGMVRGSVSSGPWKLSSDRGILAHSRRSVKRNTCRSFLAPSTSSTMKPSFSSCRFYRDHSHQGCVLSPLLFILYTNMCRSSREDRFILKYADDSVIVSLLQGNETGHGPVVQDFVDWCEWSFLQMNISKTKNICFIESVISFSLVSWFSNLPLKNKNSLNQIVRWASRLIGEPQLNLETPLH
ncbi:hypothetical protein N1851_006493 [Merluccius polli]|uniref:Reverse transcriptase domain-containing protein n=1 Tax=Merluccius polli TaxID=89951 RepID=A0AA47N487_MERPO|nr:hypothetical protein N1851_006493 [Merluccius polli]